MKTSYKGVWSKSRANARNVPSGHCISLKLRGRIRRNVSLYIGFGSVDYLHGIRSERIRAPQARCFAGGHGRSYYEGDVNLPAFITAKNLKPFIPNELYVTSSQIVFRTKKGGRAFGYPAELLAKICGVFMDADAANKLTDAQKHIAAKEI